jgi:hypothetical protein
LRYDNDGSVGHDVREAVMKVDVAISVFGKPYQTAVTLASLLQNSGQHIDTIYFQQEKKSADDDQIGAVLRCFPEVDIVHFRSPVSLGWASTDKSRLKYEAYRLSVRYQYAWETTDKDFLFLVHNDCLFTSDIVGGMLARLEDRVFAGVGMIGQCWNCPAFSARVCNGDIYESYKPSHEEAVAVVRNHPAPRTPPEMIDPVSPMPLPECRLNEFGCLIDIATLRQLVVPQGEIDPIGALGTDTGTAWFRKLVLRGYRFLNWYEGMIHSPFSQNANGHAANFNRDLYDGAEARARDYLEQNHAAVFAALTASGR